MTERQDEEGERVFPTRITGRKYVLRVAYRVTQHKITLLVCI